MRDGGFDVIIGNPPYVEYSKVRATYQVIDFNTLSCGNLYAFVMERSMRLKSSSGHMGLIVPLSLVCTRRMSTARTIVAAEPAWISCFDIRPSSLFDGVARTSGRSSDWRNGRQAVCALHGWISPVDE